MASADEFDRTEPAFRFHALGRERGRPDVFMRETDALPYRLRTVRLSATFTMSAGVRAALWLRADLTNGVKEFVTSDLFDVARDVEHRAAGVESCEIVLRVPSKAARVCYGVVCHGIGQLDVQDMRLKVGSALTGEPSPEKFINVALDIIARDSLYGDRLDWQSVRDAAERATAESVASVDAYPFLRNVLRSLKDGHSFFLPPEGARFLRSSGQPTARPAIRSLSENFGYIRLPGFIGIQQDGMRSFVDSVAASIGEVSASATGGWMLDLRESTGGNMWPLLASVHALLGVSTIGSFRSRNGNQEYWTADRLGLSIAPNEEIARRKVAVLIGPRTNSAGEAVAVAFHGREGTRFFGQSTAGRASANASYDLPDESQMHLTTATFVDRLGQNFGGCLKPDVEVNEDAWTGVDRTLEAALEWLRSEDGGFR